MGGELRWISLQKPQFCKPRHYEDHNPLTLYKWNMWLQTKHKRLMGSNSLFTVTDIHMSGCQPRGKLYRLSDTVLQGQDCQDAPVSWNFVWGKLHPCWHSGSSFLVCDDFGIEFTIHSPPALFLFKAENSSHTLIPLFMPVPVNCGSVSCDDLAEYSLTFGQSSQLLDTHLLTNRQSPNEGGQPTIQNRHFHHDLDQLRHRHPFISATFVLCKWCTIVPQEDLHHWPPETPLTLCQGHSCCVRGNGMWCIPAEWVRSWWHTAWQILWPP